MYSPLIHIVIYALSFVGIWIGSGLAIKSVERIARLLRVSSFIVSFLVLGFFTSISELSVGINSIIQNDPEIYVGNLIGATIVLLMLVIPLLAIVGHSIKIAPEFQGHNLPSSLLVIALPTILVMDGKLGRVDSLIALSLFGLLVFSLQYKRSLLDYLTSLRARRSVSVGHELLRIAFGVTTIFVASRFVVDQTLYFSSALHIPPFLVSLLLIALGTNIPELSLVVRAMFMKNSQIAFGDYLGSAVFNTFLFGSLSLVYGRPIELNNNYLTSLLFLIVGLILFYFFARTKNKLSRVEGLALLAVYFVFLLFEIINHG